MSLSQHLSDLSPKSQQGAYYLGHPSWIEVTGCWMIFQPWLWQMTPKKTKFVEKNQELSNG